MPAWPHKLRHVGLFRFFGVDSSSRLASRPQCAHRAEPPHEPLEHLDNPWSIWIWPWATTMDMHRRAMESLGEVDETVARDKPEWTTPNRVVVDLAALRLRDFSVAQEGRHPTLVVAPFALHDAALADLAPGHSLVETLLANGCSRLFLAEWKSATMETRLHTIDTQLAALNVAVDDIGPPVDLIGLCQGGWLSLVYAARLLFSLEAAA